MGLTKRALWEKYGCHPMAEEDFTPQPFFRCTNCLTCWQIKLLETSEPTESRPGALCPCCGCKDLKVEKTLTYGIF